MFNDFFENRAVYEIMWKNIIQPGRPKMIIRRMCIACWIPNATNTQSEEVILTAFLLQQWLHERTSMLRYTQCAYLFSLIYPTILTAYRPVFLNLCETAAR